MRLIYSAALVATATLFASAPVLAQLPGAGQPPPDPVAVTRGDTLFAAACAACHGVAGRGGGPSNAPDLTTSAIAMTPDSRQLMTFLAVGRPTLGMPAFDGLSEDQAADLSAKLRSLGAPSASVTAGPGGAPAGPGGPPGGRAPPESIMVGDALLGKKFFSGAVGHCSSCHSVTPGQVSEATNLSKIGSKYTERMLQNMMVLNRGQAWSPSRTKYVVATVKWPNGREEKGYLHSISDFQVAIRAEDGTGKVFDIQNGQPKVTINDRMQAHIDLLPKYRDADLHNLTAYLATLK